MHPYTASPAIHCTRHRIIRQCCVYQFFCVVPEIKAYILPKQWIHGQSWHVYDEHFDCYICPANKVLSYATTNRDGYREYRSKSSDCAKCPYLCQCTASRNQVKTVTRHVWAEYLEQVEEYRYVPKYREIYRQRKETIERVFTDAKKTWYEIYYDACSGKN